MTFGCAGVHKPVSYRSLPAHGKAQFSSDGYLLSIAAFGPAADNNVIYLRRVAVQNGKSLAGPSRMRRPSPRKTRYQLAL
jgi:hypothetical protein